MRSSYKSLAVRELGHLFERGAVPSEDGALVARFLSGESESAFEALVARHGPMVLGVCRRVLGSRHDADDAFQATFLVLARKAGSLRDPDRLGPWLYGVATRVAAKARTRAARHRHEPLVEVRARERRDADWSDVLPIVDAELNRLPAKHRDVLVLCLLEGVSVEEASRRLGCPVGTVKSRLARGRETLRARLVGRGIAPVVALAALSAADAFASDVPETLIRATLETIAASAAAPGVAALTSGAIPTMLSKSTLTASVLVGGVSLAVLGTVTWLNTSQAQERGQNGQAAPASGRGSAQVNHLKQILLAFHNFQAVNERLPAAATYGADGQPKLSWRVALLPYLEQNDLYQAFHQDEPWDSPHNKALIARMPALFETPDAPAPPGETRIRGFAGTGAIFDGAQGALLSDILDGTSNTLLVAVARDTTPWTKPGELPFIAGQQLPALIDNLPGGFQLGMVDGAVRSLPTDEARMLPYLITRAGAEVISWPPVPQAGNAGPTRPAPALQPTAPMVRVPATPAPAPRGGMMASMMGTPPRPTPAPSPSLEQRLLSVELKLDRILEKLDKLVDTPVPSSTSAK